MKVYLSPSNQLQNAYAGLKVTEGQEMPLVANVTAAELKRHGVTVYLPTATNLSDRTTEANKLGVNAYVSLHTNAGGGVGTEAFYNPNKSGSQKLAQYIYDSVASLTPTKDRGLKNGMLQYNGQGFAEVREPDMACTLVELEFHDNSKGAKWIIDNLNALGVATAKGILKYLGITWKPVPKPKPVNLYAKGREITLKSAKLYTSAGLKTSNKSISGVYWIYDGQEISGKFRITNAKNRVGIAGQVTGYIDKFNIK